MVRSPNGRENYSILGRRTSSRSEVSCIKGPDRCSLLELALTSIFPSSESFVVELVAHNPLDALLRLGDVTIIASQVGSSATSSEGSLDIETVPEILLDPGETRRVSKP